MEKLSLIIRYILVGFIMIFLFNGCAAVSQLFEEEEEKKPEELMEEGIRDMKLKNYEAATEAFQNIKDRYPYSRFAITAELKMADSLYEEPRFDEAYDAYDEFERLHPKDKNIPYVIRQKGMCHFQQIKSIERDQSHTRKAKEEFDRLVKRFPRHDYANRARQNIRECLIYLAGHELNVGHFYYKMGKYSAAIGRYKYLSENYPDMGQYHEALKYISKCKEKLAEVKEEKKKKK